MNNEIKEILETIKKCIETKDDNIESFLIDIEKWKELLDYITNLQKDRDDLDDYDRYLHTELTNLQEKYNKALSDLAKESKTRIDLQKENERLLKEIQN